MPQLIQDKLTAWYKTQHRKLPWRTTKDPYRIWISEIILQQTRVEQGLPYYENFIKTFPDVKTLAMAPLQKVLKQWQGLGYYSRARNLHATAKILVKQFGGKFPSEYEQLRSLKGIGAYTAAAIASIAFNKPYAAVDGNVMRVLSRLFVIDAAVNSTAGKKIYQNKADELLNKKQPALHNQAMMELGAMVCKPAKPLCDACPLRLECAAHQTGTSHLFPVKVKKNLPSNMRMHYVLITDGESIILSKRSGKGIWKGLYEFPKVESAGKNGIPVKEIQKKLNGMGIKKGEMKDVVSNMKHALTHRIVWADCTMIKVKDFRGMKLSGTEKMVRLKTLKRYPVPRLVEKLMESVSNCNKLK
jgi:A/G-specific adenine glycosylase